MQRSPRSYGRRNEVFHVSKLFLNILKYTYTFARLKKNKNKLSDYDLG